MQIRKDGDISYGFCELCETEIMDFKFICGLCYRTIGSCECDSLYEIRLHTSHIKCPKCMAAIRYVKGEHEWLDLTVGDYGIGSSKNVAEYLLEQNPAVQSGPAFVRQMLHDPAGHSHSNDIPSMIKEQINFEKELVDDWGLKLKSSKDMIECEIDEWDPVHFTFSWPKTKLAFPNLDGACFIVSTQNHHLWSNLVGGYINYDTEEFYVMSREIEDLDLKDIRELLNLTDKEIKKQPKICSKLLNKNYVLYGDKAILDFQKSLLKWRQFIKLKTRFFAMKGQFNEFKFRGKYDR